MTDWQSVPAFPNYEVSDAGQVRNRYGHVLKHEIVKGGYHRVSLSGPRGSRHFLVHVLVAQVFVGPKPPGLEVNHEDGDKDNNAATNLTYVTPAENIRHSLDVLGVQRARGERTGTAKLREADVLAIRAAGAAGANRMELAAQFGVHWSTIYRVLAGTYWSHVRSAA